MLKTILQARATRASVRHNSTVARELPQELDLATATGTDKLDVPPLRSGLRKRSKSLSALPEMRMRSDDAEPAEETIDANMRDWASWDILRQSEDPAVVRKEIHRVRTELYPFEEQSASTSKGKGKAKVGSRRQPQPSTTWFNGALQALQRTRIPGQPVTDVVRLYNDMLARGVLPDAGTYAVVIASLCERDWEVVRALQAYDAERIRESINAETSGEPPVPLSASEILTSPLLQNALPHHAETIRLLRAEIHLPAALALFHAAAIFRGFARSLPVATFARLLRACAARGERGGAIRVWEVLEKRNSALAPSKSHLIPAVFRHLVATYTAARDIGGAEEVFSEWLKAVSEGRIQGTGQAFSSIRPMGRTSAKPERGFAAPVDTEGDDAAVMATTGGERDVWDEMVVAYAVCGMGAKAVELVERMMDGREGEFCFLRFVVRC